MGRRNDLVSGLQWRKLEQLLDHDFADRSLADAVAAGRGNDFQRLEFLGDPVLELAVATGLAHAGAGGNEMAADRLRQIVAHTTDNRHLADVSMRSQLASLLGFRTNRKRKGDMVEAAAGALFIDGGWDAVDRFAAATGMSPAAPAVRTSVPASALVTGPAELDAIRDHEDRVARARVIGTMVVDTTLAWWAYRTMPGRDEGVLTEMVHQRGDNQRLATVANRYLPADHLRPANRLRAWVGAVSLRHGRVAAIALVSRLWNLGLPEPDITG